MNKIETIKIGDIEVPVEYLRQTTVNVNGDDYIRLQQENKQLKDKLGFYSGLELDKTIDKIRLEYNKLQRENKQLKDKFNQIIEEINWVKDLVDTCKYVDTNAITIYKIIKGDNNE